MSFSRAQLADFNQFVEMNRHADCYDTVDAARYGHIYVLELLLELGNNLPRNIADHAAAGGHVAMMQMLRAYGYTCTSAGVAHAIGGRQANALEWLLSNDVECPSWATASAVVDNHPAVLRVLKNHMLL